MKKAIIVLAMLTIANTAFCGDIVRCSGRIIEPGISKYDLIKYCGKPDAKTITGTEKSGSKYNSYELNVEEWMYQSLSRGNDYVITVIGSSVRRVRRID
ncbi:MAG: DUF2845 domain-containing protein [Syntrophotalea sp.]|uniref:DUF2845 domain-containing protein n=1 Tax=Syntrophotalea sp. TaxID=2812029 RepID=UPI003D0A37FF